ncbi:DUF3179 domain-containing protein [Muriicola sp. Z0-33]|uniref:DUF3179 domain-containing protein n=1 Tax=Muriicola sp. Z0-33 TaxID=2816957 RepID=UPI002236F8B0|nr:DUF3179 domain-containing protein [Muriicola sp. Z0-33]MCW5518150.1 DUF3179 domain-containing protein [Muriicola sp. Z0-33]
MGTAAIYMALIEAFPIKWLYYHYFIRKPVNWSIFIGVLLWTTFIFYQSNEFPTWAIAPIIISGFALILTYRMHQSRAFPAVFFPKLSEDPEELPLNDNMEMAVIEYEGITKCYPLDYVIHHHIINDHFKDRIVALTYCAMCRSIIPFDVTEIGPLFVGSFKNANMIVADKKTKTFFQQATFKSIIGPLHPYELTMKPFQILSWSEVKKTIANPQVVKVSEQDFKDFELPIPGIWEKIIASESTPGLSAKNRDKTFPSRTHVIGIIDNSIKDKVVYLKKEVLSKKIVENKENGFILIGAGKTVNAFNNSLNSQKLEIKLEGEELLDSKSSTKWNVRGKYISGDIKEDLEPIAISDEYWFSWIKFHDKSRLIRL